MNRTELVRAVSRRVDQPQWAVDIVLEGITEVIQLALATEDEVAIRGFGKFRPQTRKATVRPHPATGESMEIPASKTAKFLPSPRLRERLNQ